MTGRESTLTSHAGRYVRDGGAQERELAERLASRGLDVTVPNVARIYDFLLGGKNNFQADRDAAEQLVRVIPQIAEACRLNRDFLGRVVRALAEAGIRQFIDVGSGLPTGNSVHEIAQRTDPEARVVYADYDPVVISHAQALLEDVPRGVIAVEGDLRHPGEIIGHPRVQELIDFRQPVAVLMFAVLHFITDAEQPGEIVRQVADAMAPGSFVAVSHGTDEGVTGEQSRDAQQIYQGASSRIVPRSREGILALLGPLEVVEPGLVNISLWPEKPPGAGPAAPLVFYGGVARKT